MAIVLVGSWLWVLACGPSAYAEAEAAFSAAKDLYHAEQYEEARLAFEQFLVDYPDSHRVDKAHYLQARCHYHLGRYTVARGLLMDLLRDVGQSTWAHKAAYFIGRCSYKLGEYQVAIAQLDSFVASYPSSRYVEAARYFASRAHYELGKFAAAIAGLAQILADYPAGAYADEASYFYARSHYKLELHNETTELLASFLKAHPTSDYVDNARYYLGRAHCKLDRYAQALPHFHILIGTPASAYHSRALAWAGRAEYEIGELAGDGTPSYLRAESTFDTLFAAYPTDATHAMARLYHALSALRTGRIAVALARLELHLSTFAVSRYRDDALYYHGYTLYGAGRYGEALQELDSFLAEWPDSSFADNATYRAGRCNLALAESLADPEPALQAATGYFRTLVESFPQSRHAERAYLYLVRTFVQLDSCPDAAFWLDRFAANVPAAPSYQDAQQAYVEGCGTSG